jgi:hypothetical protein
MACVGVHSLPFLTENLIVCCNVSPIHKPHKDFCSS